MTDEISEMTRADLEEYARILEKLDEDRMRLMEALPPCGAHGSGCVPHALDWIREARQGLDNVETTLDPRAVAILDQIGATDG